MSETSKSLNFQHRKTENCSCPVHTGSTSPFAAPLGMKFASDISVREITRSEAGQIYESHHSYKPDVPHINVAHHGIEYQGRLVGAITWRAGIGGGGGRALRWGADGDLIQRVYTDSDYEKLPDHIQPLARELVPQITEAEVSQREVVGGSKFINADRICIAIDMPNLASAALARSQERIVRDHCRPNGIEYLVTFVRADYPGSMISALQDKGWICTGWAHPSNPGNREKKAIHDKYKWRWVCPVERVYQQADLGEWSGIGQAPRCEG